MSRTLRLVERARADVDHIFNWLARRSVQGAITWYMAFGRALETIAASPERFAAAPESRPLARHLQQSLFKTRRGRVYRIVFVVLETEILILRVRGPGQAPLRRRDLPSP
jgi:plasmid stabilization system protein ParE